MGKTALGWRGKTVVGATLAAAVAGGVALALTVSLVVGIVAFALLGGAALAPQVQGADWPGFWRWWRLQTRGVGNGTAVASVSAVWPSLRRLLKPDYLFVVYAGTEAQKRLFCPKWVERIIRPVVPTGIIRFGQYWGLAVSGTFTAETLEDSPDRLQAVLDETRGQFPDIEVIALAGRLPSMAEKEGIALEPPFIHGHRGTVCTMAAAAQELARLAGKPSGELSIALVGSGGFLGSRLLASLAEDFGRVIALDSRYTECSGNDNGVVYTDRPEDVSDADVVMVLTARGSDTDTLARYLAPGTVVADDTHPEIPAAIRARMEARGATVLKATMGDDRISIRPRIPTFRADDVPGCLLEALVVLDHGSEVLEDQQAFNRAAREMGFRARLMPHLREA